MLFVLVRFTIPLIFTCFCTLPFISKIPVSSLIIKKNTNSVVTYIVAWCPLLHLSITCGLLRFKAQPTKLMHLLLQSIKLLSTVECGIIKSNHCAQFRKHCRKLEGAVKHLIDRSEKCICQLSFEF